MSFFFFWSYNFKLLMHSILSFDYTYRPLLVLWVLTGCYNFPFDLWMSPFCPMTEGFLFYPLNGLPFVLWVNGLPFVLWLQANANQRSGRAGRTGPGWVIGAFKIFLLSLFSTSSSGIEVLRVEIQHHSSGTEYAMCKNPASLFRHWYVIRCRNPTSLFRHWICHV